MKHYIPINKRYHNESTAFEGSVMNYLGDLSLLYGILTLAPKFSSGNTYICTVHVGVFKYYKDMVLKKKKKKKKKNTIRNGVQAFSLKHVRLLHDITPAHTSAIVTFVCERESFIFSLLSLNYLFDIWNKVSKNFIGSMFWLQLIKLLIMLLLCDHFIISIL